MCMCVSRKVFVVGGAYVSAYTCTVGRCVWRMYFVSTRKEKISAARFKIPGPR